MQVQKLVVGSLDTNCYIVTDNDTNQTIVIDPGDDADFITQKILDQKFELTGIVFTHGHFDHVLGSLELKLNFSIPIYMSFKDFDLYNTAFKSGQYWLKHSVDLLPKIDVFLKDNEEIHFGDSYLSIMDTPGHTPGSISLYSEKDKIIFTGDTLFKQAIGDVNHRYSSALKLSESLDKLFGLPDQTFVYPGHGQTTYLGDERRFIGR